VEIYLAGKIRKQDWRHEVVAGLDEALYLLRGQWDRQQWPTLRNAVTGGFDYVGPYFCPGDVGHELHGFYYDERSEKGLIHALCKDAIRRADLIFAWIDELHCYGTVKEITWAQEFGKPVHVAIKSGFNADDLWFGLEDVATRDVCDSPAQVLSILGQFSRRQQSGGGMPREEAGKMGGEVSPSFTRTSSGMWQPSAPGSRPKGVWEPVGPEQPCPVCKSTRGCGYSLDLMRLHCRYSRGKDGGELRQDKNGKPYWRYHLVGPRSRPPRAEDVRPWSDRREP
jgi:hypothetical protein